MMHVFLSSWRSIAYLAAGVWTSLLLLPSPNPHVISHHPPRLGFNEGGSLAGDHGCTWSHVTHLVHVSLTVEGILCLLYLHHLFVFLYYFELVFFFSVLNTSTEITTESVLNATENALLNLNRLRTRMIRTNLFCASCTSVNRPLVLKTD